MKLRNKTTGEIVDWMAQVGCDESRAIFNKELIIKTETATYFYQDLFGFMRDWECEDNQPLIKDEKIRKAVKAWADANDFERLEVTHSRKHTLRVMDENQAVEIFFFRKDGIAEIDERVYSLSELCGEDEEWQ